MQESDICAIVALLRCLEEKARSVPQNRVLDPSPASLGVGKSEGRRRVGTVATGGVIGPLCHGSVPAIGDARTRYSRFGLADERQTAILAF